MSIDDPFDWGSEATATGQPHAPARPIDGQIEQGYPEGQPVPAAELNWLARQIGLAQRAAVGFTDLADLVETLEAGQSAVLLEDVDGASRPGSTHTEVVAAQGHRGLAVSGDRLIFLGRSGAFADRRDLANTTLLENGVVEYAFTNTTATVEGRNVATNGPFVVVTYTSNSQCFVECWDRDGTSLWVYRVPGDPTVYDVAVDGERAYIGHAADSDGKTVTALVLDTATATGEVEWTYAHGATVYSLAVGAGRVFFSAAASSLVTGRALRASDGATVSTAALVGWQQAALTGGLGALAHGRTLATDGEHLYQVGTDPSSSDQTIAVMSVVTGEVITSRVFEDPLDDTIPVVAIAVDQDYLYIATNDADTSPSGGLYCLDKRTLGLVWAHGETTADNDGWCQVASDGAAVFATQAPPFGAISFRVHRIHRGNRPGRFVRVDGSGNHTFPRTLAVPERS